MPLWVLVIGAHPDDCEFGAAGTAVRMRARGDVVKFVSMTNGDRGHFSDEYSRDRSILAARRLEEATKAAGLIGMEFETLGIHDGEVQVTLEMTETVIRLIRGFGPEGRGPDLVILNRPNDYHRDHRYAAQLILDAAYMLTVPFACPDVRHLDRMPVFAYWWDPFREGGTFRPDVLIPIDDACQMKIEMLACHESQMFEWLPHNRGELEKVPSDPGGRRLFLAEWLEERQRVIKLTCAEAIKRRFRDHAVKHFEVFQISEYGRQPSQEELASLFPVTVEG